MLAAAEATELLRRHVGAGLTVIDVRRLTGGMVNTVLEFVTNGDPPAIVAKVSDDESASFGWEYDALRYYRAHTTFPVPEPYACVEDADTGPRKCLLMSKVPGRNLADAGLSGEDWRRVQRDMARHVADLHEHRRDLYGPATSEGKTGRWLDLFGPQIRDEFEAVADQLSAPSRRTVAGLLDELGDWLPEFGEPTLVHGDLWATNIMVDDAPPAGKAGAAGPRVAAFLDGGANFREVEYELAYLLVFHTADATFFREYARRHAIRDGFDRRCRVYWLNTMMLHVRVFGGQYLPACERLAGEIDRLR